MTNNANDGSSSNPNPSPNRPSPGRGGANYPRGRGGHIPSPPRPTTELALITPPRSAAPPPPPQHWPPSGSGGPAFPGGHGGSAIPVGDGGGSGSGGAARVGGSPLGRKRAAAADGGGEGGRMYNCSVCNKAFNSARAMFGHMRKHPDRGWTGAHPPPAFRAEEEFADLHVGQAVDNAQAPAAAEAEEEQEEANYRVPDLNNPPPPDSN